MHRAVAFTVYMLAVTCVASCPFRWLTVLNVLSHCLHLYGLSFVWTLSIEAGFIIKRE